MYFIIKCCSKTFSSTEINTETYILNIPYIKLTKPKYEEHRELETVSFLI